MEVEELVDNYSYFLDNRELVLNNFLTYIYIRKTIIVKEVLYMTKEKKMLPDGWYTVKLLDALVCENKNKNGYHLQVAYDIVDSEYKDYFDYEFKHCQNVVNQRWHGFFYVSFAYYAVKKFLKALKESNPNYIYDRKASSLRGLVIGVKIESGPHHRSDGSVCQIKKVTKVCSVEECQLKRCNSIPPFLNEEEHDKNHIEFDTEGGE